MGGQEGREVGPHADGTDPRPAAAVGDAERLVQVEVADVAAEAARLGHADERVEVGAVDVHLPTVLVDDVAQLADAFLEHTVRRRVRHHGRGEPSARGVALARRSPRSTLPSASHATTTTWSPAITALAAFVPCALEGMRQTVRAWSPRLRW